MRYLRKLWKSRHILLEMMLLWPEVKDTLDAFKEHQPVGRFLELGDELKRIW